MDIAQRYPDSIVTKQYCALVAVIAMGGLIFQVGHFAEHALQFAVWMSGYLGGFFANVCGPDTPWMSAWAIPMVQHIGSIVAPSGDAARRMMLGMETLHLIGNTIFLTAIAATWILLPRSALVKWAFIIEGLHLCEHILLTVSAFTVGKPIGVSTLFGQAGNVFPSKELVVGYRVSWHFAMNLLPMPLAMMALMDHWARRKEVECA